MVFVCPDSHKHAAAATCWRHGCRCVPCTARERARYRANEPFRKRRVLVNGGDIEIPAGGCARRLKALAVMGWSSEAIAARTGLFGQHLTRIRAGHVATVKISTARRIERAYRDLAMTKAIGNSASVTRALALKKGWHGPLAWDRIDDPKEQPKGAAV